MDLLFDEEINSRILLKEEREEGRVEGHKEGAQDMLKKNVLKCHAKGFSVDAIADILDLSHDMVNDIITSV